MKYRITLATIFVLFFFRAAVAQAANYSPQVVSVSPATGTCFTNQKVFFTAVYSDANGWQDIQHTLFLMNTSVRGINCPYLYYNQNTNKLYLRNDASTAWLGGYAPGYNGTVSNSYCTLNYKNTAVSGSGNNLTVKWAVIFKPAFGGKTYNTYLYVRDDANAYAGWLQKGSWKVITDITPPTGAIKIDNNNQNTNFTEVVLTLFAQDNLSGSGLNKMQFSNDSVNWTSAVAYAATKNWTLPAGDGMKAVYAKFSDKSGNWSAPISDTIILDTTSPAPRAYQHIFERMDKYKTGNELRLIESYANPYPPGQELYAWVYDNALSVIMLLARADPQDIRRARTLCETLIFCQDNDPSGDGRIRNAYYADNIADSLGKPRIKNSNSYCGNVAWAAIALMHYYKFSHDTDPAFLNKALTTAKEMGTFIINNLSDPKAPGYVNYKGVAYKSTENNISAYAAFMLLYESTNDPYWKDAANKARIFVTTYMDDGVKFCVGSTGDGISANDYYLEQSEDVNSWAVLAFGYKYKDVLSWVEGNCWAEKNGFTGFDFNTDKDGIWFEGTAHMACGYEFIGDADKTNFYLSGLRRGQNEAVNNNSKGITATPSDKISTGFGEFYYPSLHLGATAWFLSAETRYNVFWGAKLEKPKLIANTGRDRIIYINDTLELDGSGSAGEKEIVSYRWDFGDGKAGNGAKIEHAYSSDDVYEVKLSVRDAGGSAATDSCFVTVKKTGSYGVKRLRGHGTFGNVNNGWSTRGVFWQNKIKVDDIDGDGKKEIVLGNNQGFVHILKYKNNTYADEWKSKNLGWLVSGLCLKDADKDGIVEIIASEYRINQCEIFFFDGKTKTQEGVIPLAFTFSIYSDDLDGDSIPEVIAGTTKGKIYIYDGKTKLKKGMIKKSGTVRAINCLDLNGDGKKEIIAAIDKGIFIFDGATKSVIKNFANTSNFCALEIGDIDKDGIKELVVSDIDGYIHVFDTKSLSEEWCSAKLAGPIYSLKLCDLDKDGNVEITVAAGKKIYIFDGLSKSKEWESGNYISNIFDLEIADTDGDGTNEIVLGLDVGYLYILNSVSKSVEWQDLGGQFYTLEVTDINNDGKLEYITGDEKGLVYIFDGQTGKLLWRSSRFSGRITGLASHDTDENGAMDIVIASATGLYILDGNTKAQKLKINLKEPQGLVVDDLDKNGHLEIATYNKSDGHIYCFDAKTGKFKWRGGYLGICDNVFLKSGDFDDDNRLELAMGSPSQNCFLLFDARGGIQKWSSPFLQTGGIRGVTLGDVDNDNITEIIAQSHTLGPVIFNGQTKDIKAEFNIGFNYGLSIGDVDDEPSLEIVTASGYADWVRFNFINCQTQKIEYQSEYLGEFIGNKGAIKIVDIDSDGKNEIIAGSDGYIIIFATPGTNPKGNDVSSPVVYANIKDDAIIYGTVSINVRAADNIRVSKIGLYVDGKLIKEVAQSSYLWQLNTALYSDGQHILKILAYDLAGNIGVKEIRVGIGNYQPAPPTISGVVSPTYLNPLNIKGNKQAYTSIWINAKEIVAFDNKQTWSAIISLKEGNNLFKITAKDFSSRESSPLSLNIFLDSTLPQKPQVIDDGVTTDYLDRLHARWSSQDPETGIVEYCYAIGSAPGAGDVSDWTNVGNLTEHTAMNLNLVNNQVYYFSVKAKNSACNWSRAGISDGITVKQAPPVITKYTPAKLRRFVLRAAVNISLSASDPEGGTLQYRISIDDSVKSDWSGNTTYTWTTQKKDFGRHSIVLEVRDNKGGKAIETVPIFVYRKAINLPVHK